MNFSTYRFTLDLQKHQSQMSIAVSRYDTAVRLCISLTDGGNPYFIEDGCIAVLWGKKANGSPISHNCIIESNTRIVYDFNESTADEPGIVNCQIRLYKDGNEIITAPKFIIVVDERIVKDEDIDLESGEFTKDELSSLDNLLLQESARVAAENERVQAELKRVAAETDREKAETELRDDVDGLKDDMSATGNQISELQEYVHNLLGYDESLTKMVNDKLDKTTEDNIIYGTTAEGKQTKLEYSTNVVADSIAQRSWDGQLYIAKNPNESPHCATSRHYVDGLVNPLEERVSDLESLTLTFTEDKAVAYEKSVPANVGKYALIKSIGGASKASDNICDPRTLTSNEEITVNADNSITFDVAANGMTSINLPTLPKGTYYWVVETNTNITVNPYTSEGVATNNPFEIASDTDNFYFEFENKNWSGGETEPVTVTAKIAVFKGSTERKYEPFFSGFKNAEVSKIESRGANLIPFPYDYAGTIKGVDYEEINNGITYKVLENGLISMVGTSTEVSIFQIFKKIMPKGDYFISGGYPSGGLLIGSYNYGTPNYTAPQNGIGTINQKFTHAGGMFGAYIKIEKGVTVNTIYSPIITRDVYVKDFKPYKAEPIDTFTIPVEAIKSLVDKDGRLKVVDYSKGIDTTDYNYIECIDGKWQYVQKCKELVLKGTEQYIRTYDYNGMHGVRIEYILDGNYHRAKGICTDTDKMKESDLTQNSMWLGANQNSNIYWIGVLDYLGMTDVEKFKTYLANRYSSGNPVRIIYKLATPKVSDITEAFTNGYKIQVQGGGSLVPVNDNELPVPTNIAYVTRKG